MHGTVNMRSSSSVGGMTRSAEQIVQINSRIERAVIEARIKPEGIAGVKSAQDATIQPAACSYWIYGLRLGLVHFVLVDTFKDERKPCGDTRGRGIRGAM